MTPSTLTLTLPDVAATDRLGDVLAGLLRPGDTVLLDAELGMGKSHLARQIVQAMQAPHGTVEDVPSPTYTLVQTYRAGPVDILHADLYRLGDPSELAELGLDDAVGSAICLIEWPDRLEAPPEGALRIALTERGEGRDATLSGWDERLALIDGGVRA